MWSEVDKKQFERDEYEYAVPCSPEELEQMVVMVRLEHYNRGLPCGAAALHGLLQSHYNARPLPSVKKIGEILARHCLTNARTGWYEEEGPDTSPAPIARSRHVTQKGG